MILRHPLYHKLKAAHYGHVFTAGVDHLQSALKLVLPKKQQTAVQVLGGIHKMGASLKRDGSPFDGFENVTSKVMVLCGSSASLKRFAEETYGDGIRVYTQSTGSAVCSFGHFGVDRSHFVIAASIEEAAWREPFVVYAEDPDVFMGVLRDRVWSKHMRISLDFSAKPAPSGSKKAPPFTLEVAEEPKRAIMSGKAAAIIEKMMVLSNGWETPRNILLWGPPGVGKTTIVLQIIQAMGSRRVVHINAPLWKDIEPFLSDIKLMRPEVLVFDDIHRLDIKGQYAMVFFESFPGIILSTANDLSRIPDSLLRPGRIDEIFQISAEDLNDIAEKLLAGVDPKVREILKGLPFADVFEFHKRSAMATTLDRQLEEASSILQMFRIRQRIAGKGKG